MTASARSGAPRIEARGLTRTYELGGETVRALRGVDLSVEPGAYHAVMGTSGSGKSTLLHVLGCLDRPTAGSYRLDGEDVAGLGDRALSRIRREHIGFVFQTFDLVPELDVLANAALPFLYGDVPTREARRRAESALDRVGLAHRLRHRPAELSGGEMQRVAVARALAIGPSLILADEPTGNLDRATGEGVLDLLDELHGDGATLVVVTHDPLVAERADVVHAMEDGRLAPALREAFR